MKSGIHPDYVATTVTCSCGTTFVTRSTAKSGKIHAEVCSQCHPFYTGKQKILDTGGRVAKFERRFGKKPAARPEPAEAAKPEPAAAKAEPAAAKPELAAANAEPAQVRPGTDEAKPEQVEAPAVAAEAKAETPAGDAGRPVAGGPGAADVR